MFLCSNPKWLYHSQKYYSFFSNALSKTTWSDKTFTLKEWRQKLRVAGITDTEPSLSRLVAHVLGLREEYLCRNYSQLYEKFKPTQLEEFQRLCKLRCSRMPLEYVVGECRFLSMNLHIKPPVCIPHAVSQDFAKLIIEHLPSQAAAKKLQLLDVGCGCGAISLAILRAHPQVQATALDCCATAAAVATKNALLLGLSSRLSIFEHAVAKEQLLPPSLSAEAKYDVIISNPPYVRVDEFQYLTPEVVSFEHRNVLDGGVDGLHVARLVLQLACRHLRSGGKLWLELGNEQPPLLRTWLLTHYADQLVFKRGFVYQDKEERFLEIEKL